jgi:hypothetical protein
MASVHLVVNALLIPIHFLYSHDKAFKGRLYMFKMI